MSMHPRLKNFFGTKVRYNQCQLQKIAARNVALANEGKEDKLDILIELKKTYESIEACIDDGYDYEAIKNAIFVLKKGGIVFNF